jgi:hypothetical protein
MHRPPLVTKLKIPFIERTSRGWDNENPASALHRKLSPRSVASFLPCPILCPPPRTENNSASTKILYPSCLGSECDKAAPASPPSATQPPPPAPIPQLNAHMRARWGRGVAIRTSFRLGSAYMAPAILRPRVGDELHAWPVELPGQDRVAFQFASSLPADAAPACCPLSPQPPAGKNKAHPVVSVGARANPIPTQKTAPTPCNRKPLFDRSGMTESPDNPSYFRPEHGTSRRVALHPVAKLFAGCAADISPNPHALALLLLPCSCRGGQRELPSEVLLVHRVCCLPCTHLHERGGKVWRCGARARRCGARGRRPHLHRRGKLLLHRLNIRSGAVLFFRIGGFVPRRKSARGETEMGFGWSETRRARGRRDMLFLFMPACSRLPLFRGKDGAEARKCEL